MATYHGKSGRFTSQRSAHTVTRGGERFKMVRQLRRIGGKAPEPEPEPDKDVVDTVEEAKAKEALAMFVSASPGWTPFHDIMGVAFDEVSEGGIAEAGGWGKISREEKIQMYKDNIETQKAFGRPVPREWIKGLAELEGGKAKGADWVYSDKVFGHPQMTSMKGYQHLIPIKVKAGDVKTVDRFIDRAQKILDKLQKETAVIDARAKGRMGTPAQKRAAKKTVSSHNFQEKLAVIDMLRKETMKELSSLRKEVAGKR